MNPQEIIKKHPPSMENLINILHDLQEASPQNYLPEESLREVARYLNTTLSAVYGVVNYYTMFSTKPRGKYIIRLCQSPICHMMGGETALESVKKLLGVDLNEPTSDGLFSVELSECLGICDVAPSMMVGDEIHGHLSAKVISKMISEIREREKTGSNG